MKYLFDEIIPSCSEILKFRIEQGELKMNLLAVEVMMRTTSQGTPVMTEVDTYAGCGR